MSWCAAAGEPERPATSPSTRRPTASPASLALFERGLRPRLLRRRRRHRGRDRALRAATTTTRSGTAPSWSSATATARSSTGSPSRSTCSATSSRTRSPSTPPGWSTRASPGALNESVSDVFAACLKQRLLGPGPPSRRDWLIGPGCSCPASRRAALRDMAHPGTAYDDPVLGKDPQPGHMDDYIDTTDDNGGVHLNSGIPNRAFQLAATAIGGSSAEGAGRIWYAALTGGAVGARHRLRRRSRRPPSRRRASTPTRSRGLGDGRRHPGAGVRRPGPAAAGRRRARRRVQRAPLPAASPGWSPTARSTSTPTTSAAAELAELVDRIDLREVAGGDPKPDMYVYDFDLCGDRATVPEQHLTDDLRRVAELVLDAGADVASPPWTSLVTCRGHGLSAVSPGRGPGPPRRAASCTGRPGGRRRPGG